MRKRNAFGNPDRSEQNLGTQFHCLFLLMGLGTAAKCLQRRINQEASRARALVPPKKRQPSQVSDLEHEG